LYGHAKAVAERKIKEANVRLCPQFMAAEDFGFYSQNPGGLLQHRHQQDSNAETENICHVHS
jgi:IAA-amino acid hydrolase